MALRNGPEEFGLVTRLLHWLTMALVLGMLVLGTRLKDMEPGLANLWLYGLHKTTGFSVLTLILLRILWHLASPPPRPLGPPRASKGVREPWHEADHVRVEERKRVPQSARVPRRRLHWARHGCSSSGCTAARAAPAHVSAIGELSIGFTTTCSVVIVFDTNVTFPQFTVNIVGAPEAQATPAAATAAKIRGMTARLPRDPEIHF